MGRAKLELKRIENTTNRQIMYSKRKKSLIKKAYELSTLCDIDLALLMFSPSDRACLFSGQTRIEDVFARYLNLPDQERENAIIFPDQSKRQAIQNREYLLRTLEQLKTEKDMALQINKPRHEAIQSDIEELEQEICRSQQQLQIFEEELRKYEPDPMRFTSMEEMEACETHLLNTLTRVVQRREHLLSKSCEATNKADLEHKPDLHRAYKNVGPAVTPNIQQNMENIHLNNDFQGWGPEAESTQAPIIANSAHQSDHLSCDLLLQGSNSNPPQYNVWVNRKNERC